MNLPADNSKVYVYAEMLVEQSVFDKMLEDHPYPELVLYEAHILTEDNYEKYVTEKIGTPEAPKEIE